MNQLDEKHRKMLLEFYWRGVELQEMKRKSRNMKDFNHRVKIWNDENLLRQKIAGILQVPIDSEDVEYYMQQFYVEAK